MAERANPLGRFWRRLRVLLNWRQHQAELREEIAQHHALKAREFESRGMSPSDAALAASRALGNVTVTREASRRVWAVLWLEDLWRDLAYAARAMVRQPLFTFAAVAGLAGGLGFSAAAFSAFNAMVYRGWDLPEGGDLVTLYATSTTGSRNRRASGFSYDQLALFAERAQTLSGVFAFERTRRDPTGAISAGPVGADYFDVLRVPLVLGRGFRAEEDRIGAPSAVIVIGHDWWMSQHRGSPDVLGKVERVRGVPFTIIGVAAAGFRGTDIVHLDGWIPLAAMPLVRPKDITSRTALATSEQCCVQAAARLAPGADPAAAAAELTALLAQARRPEVDTIVRTATVQPFTLIGASGPTTGTEIVPVFAIIFGGVGAVLLLACANVANLLLARAASRQRELGIRLSLGASRGRLVRQLMTESLLLALAAGIPAVAIAAWLPRWVMRAIPNNEIQLNFAPDVRVLVVTFGLAVVSCVFFGLAPALQATKPATSARTRVPLRSVFLSAQVTFCLVLLVAAGLFVRSAQAGRVFDPGYEHDGVMELALTIPANEDEAARATRLRAELSDLLAANGVREWAFVEHAPLAPGGARVMDGDRSISYLAARVTPEYFALMRMTMLAGGTFSAGTGAANEIVVNAMYAITLGGPTAAIGKTIVVDSVPRTVVGVVRTARDAFNLRSEQPMLYVPFSWQVQPRVLVRATEEEARRIADAIRARDASLGVSTRPFGWYVHLSLAEAETSATMAGLIGALALLLASVGIFGVFSFWVQQRRHDIGVRLALGASSGQILRMVLGASGRAIGWGLGLGLVLSVITALGLRGWLYGLTPLDPASFGIAFATLLASAALATLLPAWRAMHVNPMESMRAE